MTFTEDCAAFVANHAVLKAAKDTDETLKKRIRKHADANADDIFDPGEKTAKIFGVSITQSDAEPSPPIRARELIKAIGVEAFTEVCGEWFKKATVASKDFDHVVFGEMMKDERVTADDLTSSLGDSPKPKAWTIGVS